MPDSDLGSNEDMGDWSVIDGDGLNAIKVEGAQFPNMGGRMAYIVFNQKAAGLEWELFEDHGGDGSMFISFCAVNGRNDDWLISPQLCGKAQTISFYTRSLVMEMPELYEVYYSISGKDRSDFKIICKASNAGDDWQKIEVKLPEGATYFAIRYCSLDHYGLCLDDFTYTPRSANDGLELLGYNLYRNGLPINETVIDKEEFKNVICEDRDRFNVTAVYNYGESAPSDTYIVGSASIEDPDCMQSVAVTSEGIDVKAPIGSSVVISDISGIIIHSSPSSGHDSIDLVKGFYIVRIADKTYKISVH